MFYKTIGVAESHSTAFFNMSEKEIKEWCEGNLKYGYRSFQACAYLKTNDDRKYVRYGKKIVKIN